MTSEQIKKLKKTLPPLTHVKYDLWTVEQKQLDKELSCREMINSCLIYGTTSLKPDDYKKYENKSLYDNVLRSSKNYDPSTVHFSEFDVIKLLEKNSDKEMEI